MSLRSAAPLLGVSPMAVSKAVKSGRLVKSVVRDEYGSPKIADIELAKQEWAAGTDHSKSPGYVKERASAAPVGSPAPADPRWEPADTPLVAPPAAVDGEPVAIRDDMSLAEASAVEKIWKARLAELDYRERSAELVNAKEMQDRIVGVFRRAQQKLLGVPGRVKQRLPHLTTADVGTIDMLVRESLEELAVGQFDVPAPVAEASSG